MRTVKNLMTNPLRAVKVTTPLRVTAVELARNEAGMLPVMDGNLVVGTITDRDLCVHAIAKGLDLNSTPTAAAMTPDPVACDESATIDDAAFAMRKHKVRQVVVVRRGIPVGVISISDIARASSDPRLVWETLRSLS